MTFRMAASIDVGLYRVLRLEAATPLAEMVEALNRYQPEFLYAYGSVLGLLAAEQLDGRLRIGPTAIASSGETHTDELRDAIRAAWGDQLVRAVRHDRGRHPRLPLRPPQRHPPVRGPGDRRGR
jgi:hypothetical protein